MCTVALAPLFSAVGGGATAAGATAAAGTAASGLTAGSLFSGIGTALAVGGSIVQGVQGARAARENARLVEEQRETERAINAQRDQRARRQFNSEIRKQFAELAERGVALDSPTAVLLGQEAARELSFESQSIRQTGQARDTELSAEARAYRSRATTSLLRGGLTAADSFLTAAPDLWPSLGNAA